MSRSSLGRLSLSRLSLSRLSRFDRRAVRESVAVGAVVALIALVGGVFLSLSQTQTWTAESVAVVLPSATLDTASSAAYYETLSRGQIVATFAEIAGNLRFEEQAEDRLNLDAAARESVTTEVSVVPDTSVILIRASSPDRALAEKVADGTTAISTEYLAGLAKPYRAETVRGAAGSSYSSGTSPWLLAAASAIVALVAGLAVQQASYHLAVALRRVSVGPTAPDGTAPARTETSQTWSP